MKTFKHSLFTKRNYDCTNVVFCQGEARPKENTKYWLECDESELTNSQCMALWIVDNVQYYGYM